MHQILIQFYSKDRICAKYIEHKYIITHLQVVTYFVWPLSQSVSTKLIPAEAYKLQFTI